MSANALGVACCDSVNRGAFYAEGKIVYNLLDGHTVAVDAAPGASCGRRRSQTLGNGETTTMAPLVVGDKVIVGASGGEFGIFGWIKALDLKTGQVVWTARNMGPDAEMLRRARHLQGRPTTAAPSSARTAGPATAGAPAAHRCGDGCRMTPSSISSTTAPAIPRPTTPEQRLGDNKWSASVLARRRRATAALVWAYQFTPHDNWDYDATGAMILADLTIEGRPVKALVHFDKNGFAYTLDRATGRRARRRRRLRR